VTLLYFRVLKAAAAVGDKRMRGPAALLPAALEGLSKVAHLINLDTVVDLMDVLKVRRVGQDAPLASAHAPPHDPPAQHHVGLFRP
jgi:hypothetical protein